VCLRLNCPAIDEEPSRHNDPSNGHHIQTVLGLEVSAREMLFDGLVTEVDVAKLANNRANTEPMCFLAC
jgi:hypothetical protein